MGFLRLALVSPTDPRGEESIRMAYRSREVLDQARLFPNLSAALSETEWVVGISGRKREGRGTESIETLAPEIWKRAGGQKITLLFGPEGTGLSNEALSRCHRTAFIPTGPRFSSLNLAQAVLLVAAAIHRTSSLAPPPSSDPNGPFAPGSASAGEIEPLFEEMESALEKIGFLKAPAKKTPVRRLRKILTRAEIDSEEAKLLRAIFRQMLWAAERKKSD